MSDDEKPTPVMCSKCNVAEAGPGGILCPRCLAIISAQKLSTP